MDAGLVSESNNITLSAWILLRGVSSGLLMLPSLFLRLRRDLFWEDPKLLSRLSIDTLPSKMRVGRNMEGKGERVEEGRRHPSARIVTRVPWLGGRLNSEATRAPSVLCFIRDLKGVKVQHSTNMLWELKGKTCIGFHLANCSLEGKYKNMGGEALEYSAKDWFLGGGTGQMPPLASLIETLVSSSKTIIQEQAILEYLLCIVGYWKVFTYKVEIDVEHTQRKLSVLQLQLYHSYISFHGSDYIQLDNPYQTNFAQKTSYRTVPWVDAL